MSYLYRRHSDWLNPKAFCWSLLGMTLCLFFATRAFGQGGDIPVTKEGDVYRAGAVTMKPQGECGGSYELRARFYHDEIELTNESVDAFQDEIRALAAHYLEECPIIAAIRVFFEDSDKHVNVSIYENWQLPSRKPSQEEQSRFREASIKQELEFKEGPVAPNHDLKTYGYYNSELLGEAPSFKLYRALDKQHYGSMRYVIVHSVESDDDPLFDVRDGPYGKHTGPEFNKQLERILQESGVIGRGGEEIRHYIAGYHHPHVDRVLVSEQKIVENHLFATRIPMYWEDGEVFVSPYGVRVVTVKSGPDSYRYFLSRADIIAQFGPSAPEVVDDPLWLPDLGPLAEEAPSAGYLARQAEIREAALAKGLIYKNDAFWSQFSTTDIRYVFDSQFSNGPIYPIPRAALLMAYLVQNSQHCQDSIKDPHTFKLDDVTQWSDDFGNTSTSTTEIYDIVVPGRFVPILEKRFKNQDGSVGVSSALTFLSTGANFRTAAKQLREQIEWVRQCQEDISRLMNLGECGNPVQQQFEEMLYYLFADESFADHSTLTFANAEELSDELYEPGTAPTFKSACVISSYDLAFDVHGEDVYGQGLNNWCDCLAQHITKYMDQEKIEEYTKRYAQYQRDLRIAEIRTQRGQDHPDNRILKAEQAARYCSQK